MRLSDDLARLDQSVLKKSEAPCEVRVLAGWPLEVSDIRIDMRLARLTPDQRGLLKAAKDSAPGAETTEEPPELYSRQGEDVYDDSPLCVCFRCGCQFQAPPTPVREKPEEPETWEQLLREMGFCADCQRTFHRHETIPELLAAMQRWEARWAVENPPGYVRGLQLHLAMYKPMLMDNGTRNVVLGLSLDAPGKNEHQHYPVVKTVKQGQSLNQGVMVGDKVLAVNGWWLPPEGHPRLWEVFKALTTNYTGVGVKISVQMVSVVWGRARTDASSGQQSALQTVAAATPNEVSEAGAADSELQEMS